MLGKFQLFLYFLSSVDQFMYGITEGILPDFVLDQQQGSFEGFGADHRGNGEGTDKMGLAVAARVVSPCR